MKTNFPVNYPELIVKKNSGLNRSEQKLASLGFNTFLQLWSYPNPYKLQANGKELCDLLVVFGDDIIIFSDKDCSYGNSGDSQVDWRRWYKKSIKESAEQLKGAKSWIKRYPDRIAIDASCSMPFPFKLNISAKTRFHLIAIAHGASEACQKYFNKQNGDLIIDNSIVGDGHITTGCHPFVIGQIFEDTENFIHVFDDNSYKNILSLLDTIQDFLRYLKDREGLLLNKHVVAMSENCLLAQHMRGVIRNHHYALQELYTFSSNLLFDDNIFDTLLWIAYN